MNFTIVKKSDVFVWKALHVAVLIVPFLCVFSGASHAENHIIRFSVQNSEPKYLLEGQRISGLCGEIYSALAKQLSQKKIVTSLPSKASPIREILSDLKAGRSDAFCGAGRNDKREKEYVYSVRPVYDVSNVIVARQNDLFEPKSFGDLRKTKVEVSTFLGTTSAEYLKMQSGIRVNDSFTDVKDALASIAQHERYRFFFYHDLGLVYLVRESRLPLRVLPTKFRVYSHWMLYSRKTNPYIIEAIEDALLQIEISGELKRIQRRYTASN